MPDIIANTMDELYQKVIRKILDEGEEVTARGLTFKECRFQHLLLKNPRARVIRNPLRKVSLKFTAAEFIWMMGGRSDIEMISTYNKRMATFSDDGETLNGAYGPRLRDWNGMDQIANVIKQLRDDLYTRQAVIIILDPRKDLYTKTKDVPCNDLLQFMYREGALHMSCYVRSNDMNWGIPYDIFHWTMLQEMIASELGVPVGEYNHFIGSMHIYDKDYDAMAKIADACPEHVSVMPDMPLNQDVIATINMLESVEVCRRCLNKDTRVGLPDYWREFINPLFEV